MSNHLAIATVTAALAQIVHNAAQEAVAGAVVQFGRPEVGANGATKVHVYLYQVTPNAALRNFDLPTRDADGRFTGRPRAALNLHYLLTFYGNEAALEPSRMLGAVARDLHARPVLSAQAIQDVTQAAPLDRSDLSSAIEQVKFTPEQLSLEDFSRVWSVLVQTPHALSIAYQASVVLIDAVEAGAAALPVLSRGEGDTGVDTRIGPFPRLDGMWIGAPAAQDRRPRPASQAAAALGDRLLLSGENLGGDAFTARFSHSRLTPDDLPVRQIVVAPADRTATELRIDLPNDVAAQTEWAAGVYTIEAQLTRSGGERISNVVPLALAPRITAIQPNPAARVGGDVTVDITCRPRVLTRQSAFLLLAGRETPAEAHANPTDTLRFIVRGAPAVQDALVRLRIDGVDSLPFTFDAVTGRFAFDAQQRVTIT